MFRTRDFLLLFSVISFLVFAIGGTLLLRFVEDRQSAPTRVPDIPMINNENITYTASVSATDTISRDKRLSEMRSKIAARGELIKAPETEVLPTETESIDIASSSSAEEPIASELRCANYRPATVSWNAQNITLEVREGSRFIQNMETVGAAGPVTEFILPIRSGAGGATNCIAQDVIGIAQDGSLIRNSEAGLYGVFGPSTVVGYALDGFPIYGASSQATDRCGGTTVAGQYGYYINPDRNLIINCFAAPPVSI